jgi:hypothetical protein
MLAKNDKLIFDPSENLSLSMHYEGCEHKLILGMSRLRGFPHLTVIQWGLVDILGNVDIKYAEPTWKTHCHLAIQSLW